MTRHHQAAAFLLLLLSAAAVAAFLLLLLSAAAVAADDEAVMSAFLSGLPRPPSGWSGSTPYCQWTGVKCDASKRVTDIDLDYKYLPGTLPSDLNKLSELKTIYVRHNAFSGAFPSLSGLASLEEACFDGNMFDSLPPGFLKGLTGLLVLSLNDNRNLPPWSLPADLSDSRGIVTLYAANAGLTGPLPDMFGSLSQLGFLNLSRNSLSGPIPHSLAVLPNINDLDLSYNNLTGKAPLFRHGMVHFDIWGNKFDNGESAPRSSPSNQFDDGASAPKSLSHGIIVGLIAIVFVLYFK